MTVGVLAEQNRTVTVRKNRIILKDVGYSVNNLLFLKEDSGYIYITKFLSAFNLPLGCSQARRDLEEREGNSKI